MRPAELLCDPITVGMGRAAGHVHTPAGDLDEITASNAGVPGVACLCRRRAQTLAEVLQTVRPNQGGEVFHALVAELTRPAQSERTAVSDGKVPAVHAVGEKRLRVQRVGHVDAAPPTWLDREVHDVSGFRTSPCEVQHVGKRHADPLGDERPSFLAPEVSDLAPGWKTAEVV